MELANLTTKKKKKSCTPTAIYQILPTFPGLVQDHLLTEDLEVISENHFHN